jgi:hypothetical protein
VPSGAVIREGRTQPVMVSHCQTSGCHHGNDGRNCESWPHATQHCTGNVTRWK